MNASKLCTVARTWGYPAVPALYLLGVAVLVVNTFLATPGRALAGLLLISLGLPVFAYDARRLPPGGLSGGFRGPDDDDPEALAERVSAPPAT